MVFNVLIFYNDVFLMVVLLNKIFRNEINFWKIGLLGYVIVWMFNVLKNCNLFNVFYYGLII